MNVAVQLAKWFVKELQRRNRTYIVKMVLQPIMSDGPEQVLVFKRGQVTTIDIFIGNDGSLVVNVPGRVINVSAERMETLDLLVVVEGVTNILQGFDKLEDV